MKKKLKLNDLSVQSFITNVEAGSFIGAGLTGNYSLQASCYPSLKDCVNGTLINCPTNACLTGTETANPCNPN